MGQAVKVREDWNKKKKNCIVPTYAKSQRGLEYPKITQMHIQPMSTFQTRRNAQDILCLSTILAKSTKKYTKCINSLAKALLWSKEWRMNLKIKI